MAIPPIQRLHCLTADDSEIGHPEQAEALCSAGIRWIQLRMKGEPTDQWFVIADEVKKVCRRHGAIFLVNDWLELALSTKADGVHLGQDDASPQEARDLLGPDAIVGVTVHDRKELDRASADGSADYLGIGPFRRSPTKGDFLPSLETAELDALLDLAGDLPAIVIGGVTSLDIPHLIGRGAHGVAVCSHLFSGGKMKGTVKALLAACDKALGKAA